jgi:hypothetical protein
LRDILREYVLVNIIEFFNGGLGEVEHLQS